MRLRVFAFASPRSLAAAVIALVLLWPHAAAAEPRSYEIDPDHLFVTFMVEHAGYARIVGQLLRGQGQFVYDEEQRNLESGTVTLYASSVFTGNYQRDKVLRGPGFLKASEHARIEFEVSRFQPTGDGTGRLIGRLEMLGETHTIELEATINRAGPNPSAAGFLRDAPYVIGVSARGTILRSRWGMQGNVDAGLLADEIELIVEFEAHRQRE